MTLNKVKQYNRQWFDPKTADFFGDKHYEVLQADSGHSYLVRETAMWSDMFGQPKKYVWRVNLLTPQGNRIKIESLEPTIFQKREEVLEWLKNK